MAVVQMPTFCWTRFLVVIVVATVSATVQPPPTVIETTMMTTTTTADEQQLSFDLTEGSLETVWLNLSADHRHGLKEGRLSVVSRNPSVCKVENASVVWNNHQRKRPSAVAGALRVTILAHSLGRTTVDVGVLYDSDQLLGEHWNISHPRKLMSFEVVVERRGIYKTLGTVFTACVAIITLFTTFLLGTQLEWQVMLREVRRPVSLLIGIGFEFLMMPLIAFGIAWLILSRNYSWQLSYLAIGSCPGAGHSPFWTMMLDGNLDLAVAMSFVASIAALGVLPFWLFTLGRVFYDGRVNVPYFTICLSMFGLICPIFVGLALKHFRPRWAEHVSKIVKQVTFVSFVVLAAFGCAVNWYVFKLLNWRHMVCGMLLPWCGYTFSYIFSRVLCRRDHADSLAVAIENGCLHVAVPVVLIQISLPQPDADLSLVVPVGVVIFATWPLWFLLAYSSIKKRMLKDINAVENPSKMSAQSYMDGQALRPRSTQSATDLVSVDRNAL